MTTQNRYDTGLNYVVADQPPAPIDQTSLIRLSLIHISEPTRPY